MEGDRDSVALVCKNCQTAWEAVGGRFAKVNLSMIKNNESDSIYLPFWKISARIEGVHIKSFSDFIRVTNQPRILKDAHEKKRNRLLESGVQDKA